jgi:hypothetical protein
MADYSTTYTLSTGGGTIVFNDGQLGGGSLDDLYWIATVNGLDGPTIRTVFDDVPYGDGGLIHKFWKGPRHVIIEGALVVQSVPFGNTQCQEILNGMEAALNAALDSILQTDGTLAWTPTGGNPSSLAVRYEVSLDIQPQENYALRSFNLGLISGSADI